MKTPKKPIEKSPLVDSEAEMEDSHEEVTSKNKFEDEDEDFDLPLDDLETFDNFSSDDDDEDY